MVSKMADHGYGEMPIVEETLATHLAPNSAPSWKANPMNPMNAAATLHSMGVLQTYQAELLKELDEGEGLTPEAVKELRRATDLALKATKHTGRAVGRSMAALAHSHRHQRKGHNFSLGCPISKDSLFGDSVTMVVEKLWAAKQHSAAFRQLIPGRPREAERQPPMVRLCSSSLHRHQV